MRVIAVIPARYGSTRLPGKPLASIHGKPMIQWVYEAAARARTLREIWVATDDERIVQVVQSFGGRALMTSPDCQSGTDRVAEVAQKVPGEIYVNIQGDEPLMDPEGVDRAVELIQKGGFDITTLMTPFHAWEELDQNQVVKVLVDHNQKAVYFSRYPIPYSRGPRPERLEALACRKHVGLYVYTREALARLQTLSPTPWEQGESLEQLRALYHGMTLGVAEVNTQMASVDTPDDLKKVQEFIQQKHKV